MVEAPHLVERAILKTLLYADIFDFPLTPGEVHHRLIECRASVTSVDACLEVLHSTGQVERFNGYVAVTGRSELFDIRHERALKSADLWHHARHWAARLAALPFVRMVAVTGALAVNNVAGRPDIDFLVVTAPGRLWLCRALAVALVRAAAARGVLLCPNYLITTRRLHFEQHNLFTAHDLVQMVPLYGEETFQEMWEQNRWWEPFLPQARERPAQTALIQLSTEMERLKHWGEWSLAGKAGSSLEGWEQQRKSRKLRQQLRASHLPTTDPMAFDGDVCKGHFEGHAQRTLQAYQARLRRYGLTHEKEAEHAHRY